MRLRIVSALDVLFFHMNLCSGQVLTFSTDLCSDHVVVPLENLVSHQVGMPLQSNGIRSPLPWAKRGQEHDQNIGFDHVKTFMMIFSKHDQAEFCDHVNEIMILFSARQRHALLSCKRSFLPV